MQSRSLASPGNHTEAEPFTLVAIPWAIVLRERTGRILDDFYLMQATRPDGEVIAFAPLFTDYDLALGFLQSLNAEEQRTFSAVRVRTAADFATMLEKLREAEMENLAFDFAPGTRTRIAPIEQILEAVRSQCPTA